MKSWNDIKALRLTVIGICIMWFIDSVRKEVKILTLEEERDELIYERDAVSPEEAARATEQYRLAILKGYILSDALHAVLMSLPTWAEFDATLDVGLDQGDIKVRMMS